MMLLYLLLTGCSSIEDDETKERVAVGDRVP